MHEIKNVKQETPNSKHEKIIEVSGSAAPNILDEMTLVDWLLEYYPPIKNIKDAYQGIVSGPFRPGIVHRLDKDTSGIVVAPKTQAYFDYLKDLFKHREVRKKYLALVLGWVAPSKGVIDRPIGIKTGTMKRSLQSVKMQKSAVTEYAVKARLEINGEKCTLLEVTPKTGRTHQIRIHLASLGHPILGDAMYGTKKSKSMAPRQLLHAESLEFNIAQGKRIKLSADLPDDFRSFLR